MTFKKNFIHILLFFLSLAALVLFFFRSCSVNSDPVPADFSGLNADLPSAEEKRDISSSVKKTAPRPVKKLFRTKEDIKKEYGRLEVVTLYSGKKYEGAVISIDDYYTIVTVNGTERIPMTEVRVRDIIR